MTSISKMHPKCDKCKHKNDCDEKRMVACAIMESPDGIKADIKAPIINPVGAEIARKHTPITINMGEYGTINTSLEEMHKKVEEDIYKRIRCDFNRL